MPSVIQSIVPGSPSWNRIRPGEALVRVNGNVIHDVLDYKYFCYEAHLLLELRKPNGTIHLVKMHKAEGEDPGLEFETYLMDRERTCANNCIFCFVDQMPEGMRKTLYVKDDDARLSFLMGNYITLTNLSPREVQRIIDLHVSPINVSVHATNPELRSYLLGNKNGGRGLEIMRRFAENGIVMNCQIVCCPGINDGAELDRSLHDLADMYPGVGSVSIVPVGLTKYREGLTELRPFTGEEAVTVIRQVEAFAEECKEKLGTRLFFCSDEFYLKAGLPIHKDEYYESYTQLENGVGMLRLLKTEFDAALKLFDTPKGGDFTIATGVSASKFLDKLLRDARKKCPAIQGKVIAIVNDFFGHTIDVAGLITGGDLIRQLKGKNLGEKVFIPGSMLRHGEGVFLDDVTLQQAEQALGVPVVPLEIDGYNLCQAIFGYEKEEEEENR